MGTKILVGKTNPGGAAGLHWETAGEEGAQLVDIRLAQDLCNIGEPDEHFTAYGEPVNDAPHFEVEPEGDDGKDEDADDLGKESNDENKDADAGDDNDETKSPDEE